MDLPIRTDLWTSGSERQKSVTTDSGGDASFTFKTTKKVPKGQVVTATATNQSTGDTSEFSEAEDVT